MLAYVCVPLLNIANRGIALFNVLTFREVDRDIRVTAAN